MFRFEIENGLNKSDLNITKMGIVWERGWGLVTSDTGLKPLSSVLLTKVLATLGASKK